MSILVSTGEALRLLAAGDALLWQAVAASLGVALGALVAAVPVALLLALPLAMSDFFGRRAVVALLQSLLAVPTVVIGLVLYMLLSREGPLGALELIFTPHAMAAGQFLIALPVLASFALSSLQGRAAPAYETARTLGAGRARALATVISETRFGLAAALFAGFGRIISEVGCALMVGGNIRGYTRTIPTAIALETGRGKFAEGIALGLVLLLLAAVSSLLLAFAQGRGHQDQL